MVAALATTKNEDRAVVTGGRNYFRTMGAAFGLAIANAIYQHDLSSQLAATPGLTSSERENLASSALADLDALPEGVKTQVIDAYAHGLRMVFIAFTAIAGLCALTSLLIKEVPFRKDTPEMQREMEANRRKARGGRDEESESPSTDQSKGE